MILYVNIILIIMLFGIIIWYMYYSEKKESFFVTNAQMQLALNRASTNFTSSVTNLENLEKKFKNLDVTMTRLLNTQTSDIEKLKKAIAENLQVVKTVDEKLDGKIKTISDILTGDYIVGAQTTTPSSTNTP